MKICLLFLPILLMSQIAHAHDENLLTPEFRRCEAKANGVTFDTLDCVDKEFTRQDKRLNTAYQALLAALPRQKQDELRKTQRAWLDYTEKDCAFLYDGREFNGQDDRLNAAYCALEGRAERATALEQILGRIN
jgi:uncharacterized protein YecT (DUF1311 family)